MNKYAISLLSAAVLAGCGNLAPEYQRPGLPVSANWPTGYQANGETHPDVPGAAHLVWRDFLTDPKLQTIVAIALNNNRDLRVAALNIEKAQTQYQIERAALFPRINATASDNATLTPSDLSSSHIRTVSHNYNVGLGFSAYELDFFGRVGNLKDLALEQYLTTEEAHRSARISLIAQVATAYLTLAADQEHLSLATLTLKAQQTTLTMDQRRFELGVVSQLNLSQSQTVLDTARGDVARYTSIVAQDMNALTLLAGAPLPENTLPATSLTAMDLVREISPGLPSDLLQNRPDILQAEHQLKAANANIGIARAAFFPSITLTSSVGTASKQLSGLFAPGSLAWQFAPQLNLPIFNAGSNTANLKSARTDQKIYLAQYEKGIQSAFREVADALADHASMTERVAAQQSLVDATALNFKLSDARFQKGVDSYLTALDSQRSLYAAEHNLINLKLAQANNRITLYKTLGGGDDDLQ